MAQTFEDLTDSEFRSVLANLDDDSAADLTDSTFFGAMAALDAAGQQQVIELTGKVVDGRLVFAEPTPVPVEGNTIRLPNQTVVITLEPMAQSTT